MLRNALSGAGRKSLLFRPASSGISIAKSSCARDNPGVVFERRRWMSSTPASTAQWYTWGTNNQGSLLHGEESKLDVPIPLEDWRTTLDCPDNSVNIKRVVCGAKETAVLLTDGRCFVSGENKSGQLGLGHKNPVTKPTLLDLPPGENDEKVTIDSISLGSLFSAAIDNKGDLYSFGYCGSTLGDGLGFLGHGDGEEYLKPKLVESLIEDGCFAQKVQVGNAHMTVMTTEGEVLTCGGGSFGRLGNSETHQDQLHLEPVEMLRKGVMDVSGGNSFTLALKDDGVLYGWGKGDKGQLGTGFGMAVDMYVMASVPEPIEADELLGRKVVKVSSGGSHAVCVTEGGEVFQWGMSLFLEPVRVSELLHTRIVDVACGENYSLALDEEGNLYSWGHGKTGVLGQGPSINKLNQAHIMEALEDKRVTAVSAGGQHVACLAEDK